MGRGEIVNPALDRWPLRGDFEGILSHPGYTGKLFTNFSFDFYRTLGLAGFL